MRGNTSMRDFNRAMCEFYGHPGWRGSTEELGRRALDYVLKCETRLLIIDDLHFLHWQNKGGIEISNNFKYIVNDFPITLVSIGIGLIERGVLMDASYDELLAQTSRRTTVLTMEPYLPKTESQRRDWRTLLTTIEQRLVLGDKRIGMLAEDLSDYLYERSTGHIGSLMDLIRRDASAPSERQGETLNRQLLDTIKIDSAAERTWGTRRGIPHPEAHHQAQSVVNHERDRRAHTAPARHPAAGEAIDSWLERIAHRCNVTWQGSCGSQGGVIPAGSDADR